MTEQTQEQIEQIEELVDWITDSWDMSALVAFATETLIMYYMDEDNQDDFIENYNNMVEIKGEA